MNNNTIVETRATQVNMLHRRTNAFGWELQLMTTGNIPISLTGETFTFTIIDRRGGILLTATLSSGLALSPDTRSLLWDVPTATIDPLGNAHKYVLHRQVGADQIAIIGGAFNVVDTYHSATLRAHVQGDNTLVQATLQGPPLIKVQSCHVYGLDLKADLVDGRVPLSQLPPGLGNTEWGDIGGTLSAQTDLVAALAAKYDSSNPSDYQTASQVNTRISLALAGYATQSWVTSQGYITSAALAPYLLSSTAASTYYPLSNPAGYISGITAAMVTAALGFTPYNATNPAGYITAAALSGYVPYAGATAALNMGTHNIVTTGNVGIGTITPSQRLHVVGDLLIGNYSSSTNLLRFANVSSVGNSAYIGRTASADFEIAPGSVASFWIQGPIGSDAQALTIRGNGNNTAQFYRNQRVRIGGALATNPNATLEIVGASSVSGEALRVQNSSATILFQIANNNQAGFFGKLASQAVMPAKTAGVAYTSDEQDMLQKVYDAVRNFGIGN